MVCPLLAAGVLATPSEEAMRKLQLTQTNRTADLASECLGEDCGWWVPAADRCAMRCVGERLAERRGD